MAQAVKLREFAAELSSAEVDYLREMASPIFVHQENGNVERVGVLPASHKKSVLEVSPDISKNGQIDERESLHDVTRVA